MRWWNQGAPQTKVSRSIGGGAWSVIQTFGPLPANAYIDFRDLQAAPDTENCYRVAASDGMNAFSALYTPARCVITHDDRDRPVFRPRLQVHVADVADARSEERSVGKGWVRTCRTGWEPGQSKKK